MNAQQLARKRLAEIDIATFFPPPQKEKKKAKPTKPAKPAPYMTAEQRKVHRKEYNRAYYQEHKEAIKAKEAEKKKTDPNHRSNALNWYYAHRERCLANNKEWRAKNQDHKTEYMRKWRAKHPGYFTNENKLKRKEKREHGTFP